MDVTVIVEGAPASPGLRDALLSACSDLRARRVCTDRDATALVMPPDTAATDTTATVAVITWPEGDLRHVRISLEQSEKGAPRIRSHEARFADQDPPIERWRAVGLAISTMLAGGADAEGSGESPDPGPARPELGPDSVPADHPGAGGWAAIAGIVGPGLDDGTVRAGGMITVGHAIPRFPLFANLSASYAVRSPDASHLSVRWLTFGAGGGTSWSVSMLNLGMRARAELLLQDIKASLGAPVETTIGGGERLSPGIRAGIEGVWPDRSPLALTAGIQGWAFPGGTGIRLDHRLVGSSSWLGYAGFLGGQCALP